MNIIKTLTINGTKYDVVPVVPATNVVLLASAWVGDEGKCSQVVEIPGVTPHTKVDLQPTAEQLAEFHHKVLGFVAENDGGVVTVYAIGDKPTGDHTIQITKTEVEGTGKIRGNTVGTTMPRPDWNQDDPDKADYIRNKPVIWRPKDVTIACDEYGEISGNATYLMMREYLENEDPIQASLLYAYDGKQHYAATATVHVDGDGNDVIFDFASLGTVHLDATNAWRLAPPTSGGGSGSTLVHDGSGEGSVVIGDGTAYGDYSVSLGKDTIAGCKGYYIVAIDPDENHIYLSRTKVVPTWEDQRSEYDENFVSGYRILEEDIPHGNEFSISSNGYYHWVFAGNIVEISGNRITYESDILNTSDKWLSDNGAQECVFYVPVQHDVGSTDVGYAAFVEGWETHASGDHSHAEGYYSIAAGRYSHAEGQGTIATKDYQHVQGKYNLDGNYAHIVGNGTSSKRSNAHTLDWDGNAWFAGSVYSGGTGSDYRLVTAKEVDAAMGDIESALDRIIEIQNSLIGGEA